VIIRFYLFSQLNEEKLRKSFYLVLIVFFVSSLFSFTVPEFSCLSFQIKKLNIFSDINSVLLISGEDTLNRNNNIFLSLLSDSSDCESDSAFADGENFKFLEYFGNDSAGFLINFFNALKNTEQDGTKTRIAFLGDSMIEGDLVSQTLRKKLQDKFGGKGVGYIPITSNTAGFRKSVRLEFSDNWKTYSLISSNYNDKVGLSGYVFIPQVTSKKLILDSNDTKGLSWVSLYPPEDSALGKTYFNDVKLYYSPGDSNNFVLFRENSDKYILLSGNDRINEAIINSEKKIYGLKLFFNTPFPVDIYGISLESESGVFVDNYSLRGNSGLPMITMNKNILSGLNKFFNYNLIILQYGLNVAEPESKNLDWYKDDMVKTINFFKDCFPFADIIIMSVSDKCYKKNGIFITEPSIPLIVNLQREAAKETGVVFWNLFETMGGKNSMIKWVKNTPPLANKDFTHFNYQGAEKVGKFFYKQLVKHYLNFRKNYN